jgi:hypothetical protein
VEPPDGSHDGEEDEKNDAVNLLWGWSSSSQIRAGGHRRRNRGGRAPRPCSGATTGGGRRAAGAREKKTPPPPLPLSAHGHGRTLHPSSSFTASPLCPDLAGGGAPQRPGAGALRRWRRERRGGVHGERK